MDLDQLLAYTSQKLREMNGRVVEPVRYVIAPYRICPLGAHVDHQGGPVLGRTVDAYSILAFTPSDTAEINLASANYPERSSFSLNEPGPADCRNWDRYAKGAAWSLAKGFRLKRGLTGFVWGTLPGGGLSSSASVGLAYLAALSSVNELSLDRPELIELDLRLENGYLGLQNGILDQTTILYGQVDKLLHINTQNRSVTTIEDPPAASRISFLIFFSGYSRDLTSTGFNQRVIECREAARILAEIEGESDAKLLGDIPKSVWEKHKNRLPTPLRRRAQHFFTEGDRVRLGRRLWYEGDLSGFGALMNQSCVSSIEAYESGSGPIIKLQEIVRSTPGVLGSRFNGGGYGGCVVALAENGKLEGIKETVGRQYQANYPEVAGRYRSFTANYEGGLRLL